MVGPVPALLPVLRGRLHFWLILSDAADLLDVVDPYSRCSLSEREPLLDRPHCFASFCFSRLAWFVLLVAIEVSHGLSRFAHVGLALAAGFGVDPLGGVFVQVDDG